MLVCGVDDVSMDQIGIGDVIPPSPAVVGGGRNCVMRHGPTTVLATQPSPAQPSTEQSFMLRLSCSHTSIGGLAVDCRHDEQEKISEICLC